MNILRALTLPSILFVLSVLAVPTTPCRADLMSYIQRPEPEAKWNVENKLEQGGCTIWQLHLVSQVWEGIKWEHDLVIFRPTDAPVDKMLIINEGGHAKPEKAGFGIMLATRIKAPVAMLLGIPNQPLFDGKKEDDLIAETFVRYLDTKDENWPLLFPMAKSLVKAMDAIQEFSAREWSKKTEKFIVGGASKRGWTTWLTAAADPRVMAITPMVIDTLNMGQQLPHQLECFGRYSDEIKPYTSRGLVPMPDTAEARRLWGMVDPWKYREKFTMPKLVVCGNCDPYWSTDALNLYWNDLPGDKWISYTPNAGHDLTEKNADGSKGTPFRAINNVCAFVRCQMTGRPMPKVSWKHDEIDGKMRLSVTADPAPRESHLWLAKSASRDFRAVRWEPRTLAVKDGKIEALIDHPETGYVAFYADCGYEVDDIPQCLCTQLRLAGQTHDGGKP